MSARNEAINISHSLFIWRLEKRRVHLEDDSLEEEVTILSVKAERRRSCQENAEIKRYKQ